MCEHRRDICRIAFKEYVSCWDLMYLGSCQIGPFVLFDIEKYMTKRTVQENERKKLEWLSRDTPLRAAPAMSGDYKLEWTLVGRRFLSFPSLPDYETFGRYPSRRRVCRKNEQVAPVTMWERCCLSAHEKNKERRLSSLKCMKLGAYRAKH